jgi:glycogen(starch) synthase
VQGGLPRRVLMTADAIGGVWTYALELARGLAPYGVEVALATMGELPSATQRAEAARLENVDLFESRYRLEWMPDPWEDVDRAGDWLLGLEQQLAPDLVHLNGYAHAALPWRAPALVVGHSCVLSWWEAVKGAPAPAEWDEYRHRVARGWHAARRVVAPTAAMLAALGRHYGPLGAARVIPNGRDPRAFGSVEKEPFIFAAGRLGDEAKNIATLARAAEGLPWRVLVAGHERDASGHAGLPAGRLEHLGHLPPAAVAEFLSRAAIYALPARYEPFGLSILEAALSGCALVLGDIASLRELWDGAAVFVRPNDAEALRDALHDLIEDPAQRERLGADARARAVAFTPERMVRGYLELYRELLLERRLAPIVS